MVMASGLSSPDASPSQRPNSQPSAGLAVNITSVPPTKLPDDGSTVPWPSTLVASVNNAGRNASGTEGHPSVNTTAEDNRNCATRLKSVRFKRPITNMLLPPLFWFSHRICGLKTVPGALPQTPGFSEAWLRCPMGGRTPLLSSVCGEPSPSVRRRQSHPLPAHGTQKAPQNWRAV